MLWIDDVKGGNVINDDGDAIGRVLNVKMDCHNYSGSGGYGGRVESILTLEIHIPDLRDANELMYEMQKGGL